MRRRAAVAGVVVAFAFAVTPAVAQPAQPAPPAAAAHSSSWRAAASAALAFGYAEGKAAALARVPIPTAPATKKATEAVLDQLDRAASEARAAFASVQRPGSDYWAAAADVRIGDMFACQADMILAIPPPKELLPLPPGFMELLPGLVKPLSDEARRHWERAAKERKASRYWSGVGWERLTGAAAPDC